MTPDEFENLLGRRYSARAFTTAEVPFADMSRMCRAARQAPSSGNLQPGKFHVLSGQALRDMTAQLQASSDSDEPIAEEYSYFPKPMSPELKARQRAAGYALYSALGIGRRDIKKRKEQFACNYRFFDAPVGVVVTIDKDMGKGCFMDLGMALMAFVLCAESLGYAATSIGALANYGPLVAKHLCLPKNEMVVCGIAVGVADPEAPVNKFRTERSDLAEYSSFRGFDAKPQK